MTLTSTMPRLHALLAVLVFGSHVLCHSQAFLINKLSFITSGQRQHPIAPTAALTVKRTSLLGRRDSHDHDWRRRDHAGRLERCGRGLQHLRSLADEDNMGIESGDGGDVQALLASETPFIELDERDGVDRRGIFGGTAVCSYRFYAPQMRNCSVRMKQEVRIILLLVGRVKCCGPVHGTFTLCSSMLKSSCALFSRPGSICSDPLFPRGTTLFRPEPVVQITACLFIYEAVLCLQRGWWYVHDAHGIAITRS